MSTTSSATRNPARVTTTAVLVLATIAACGGSSKPKPVIAVADAASYHPAVDASRFVGRITNPYLPLLPGARWVYDGDEHVEVVVTSDSKTILGIKATVVRDTVSIGGVVKEDTYDWYAQDRDGNVWYLGEATQEYDHGKVTSTEGSWEGGVDGALPGIAMPAQPVPGPGYRQEYRKGEAEDLAQVLRAGQTVTVGGKAYADAVVIREWTPLEPDVVEEKTYAPGVGNILGADVKGSSTKVHLTSFTPGR